MEAVGLFVPPSLISHRTTSKLDHHQHHRRRRSIQLVQLANKNLCSTSSSSSSYVFSFPISPDTRSRRRWRWRSSARRGGLSGDGEEEQGGGKGENDEVERALGMDGSIPGSSAEFLRRVSSRAYDMRRHLNQILDSVSYDVLETNPWRDESKPVYVLTHKDNQLCTMKTRRNRSEVERELGLLFSKGGKRGLEMGNKAKQSSVGTKFNMFVEDIRDGVLVFEDEDDATKYCDLLDGGGQGCEGIAELEVSSVFDICRRMRAIAVLFRRGTTPPLPKSLEQNLRARKRSLEDQDTM